MHEESVARAILKTVLQSSIPKGRNILKISVAAGVLSGIEPESLAMYMQLHALNTPAQDAKLELKIMEARIECMSCGKSIKYISAEPVTVSCTACGGHTSLKGGNELFLESIEVED